MTAARHDLIIEQGATFSRVIQLKQTDGSFVDITGWEARGQVRPTIDSEVNQPFTCVVDAENHKITISLSAVQTGAMTPGKQVYDLEVVDVSDNVIRLMQGIVKITPEVTR